MTSGGVLRGLEQDQRPDHRPGQLRHLKYFEGNRYGYDVYEVTPQRFSSAHAGDRGTAAIPASPVTTLTTFHVDRGKVGSYEDEGDEELTGAVAQGLLTQAADCTGARL